MMNRRKFFKKSAQGVAVVSILPTMIIAAAQVSNVSPVVDGFKLWAEWPLENGSLFRNGKICPQYGSDEGGIEISEFVKTLKL